MAFLYSPGGPERDGLYDKSIKKFILFLIPGKGVPRGTAIERRGELIEDLAAYGPRAEEEAFILLLATNPARVLLRLSQNLCSLDFPESHGASSHLPISVQRYIAEQASLSAI